MRVAVTVAAMSLLVAGLTPAAAASGRSSHVPPAPKKTKVTFYVGLDRPEKAARDALRTVSDPTSAQYRKFPSRTRIAKKYGASTSTIKAASKSVGKYGLSLKVDGTGVFAAVKGTAKQMQKWLGKPVLIQGADVPGGEVEILFTKAAFPKGASKGIREFYGWDFKAEYGTAAQTLASKNPAYDGVQTGTPERSCLPASSAELSAYTYSINELREAYGVDALPAGPKVAKAVRAVILAQGDGFSDSSLALFAECFQLPKVAYNRVNVPGLQGALPEGDEGDLDVQVMHSVLPGNSRVDVVQSSDIDGRDFLIWSTAYNLKRRADVISISYGDCEPVLKKQSGPQQIAMTEAVLARVALSGTSSFSAAGDRGSSDCVNNATGKGNKRLAVDYPGSSEFVTSVGGSRIELTAENTRSDEVVWFGPAVDSAVIPPSTTGGGGGRSILFGRPWWQPKSVVKSSARTVPDVVAHAAQTPGWPVVTVVPGRTEPALIPVGGTSAATPFTAASVGLIVARERMQKRPSLGLIQPLLYHLAKKKPSTFYDIVTGNNDVFGKGCCSAKKGYDEASGLGATKFDKLADRIPPPG
jgi:kumamolisin